MWAKFYAPSSQLSPGSSEEPCEAREMSFIGALYILMKSCRFLMVKYQNHRSK